MLRAIHLKKTFKIDKNTILTPVFDVNFELKQGERIAICGKSGEGKSTIAHLLTGMISPDGGNVELDGNSLYDAKGRYDRARGCAIQLIPQSPIDSLDPAQSIGSAVTEAVCVHRKCRRREGAEEARALFDKVGLDRSLADRTPYALSGGQAQRAAIARALAVNPKVLIADEATSMLDVSTQAQIMQLLIGISERERLSLIIISHDGALTKKICGTRYLLSGGVLTKETNI